MQFKSLADMQKGLSSIIESALASSDDVRSEVARVESKAVEDFVYAKYSPKGYERRGRRGGLADPDNLERTYIGSNGKTIQMTFENTTLGNDTMKGEHISDGIEDGTLDWKTEGTWSEPRPFLDQTAEKLRSNDNLRQAVVKSLNKSGLNFK